jgi:hypothetical protein
MHIGRSRRPPDRTTDEADRPALRETGATSDGAAEVCRSRPSSGRADTRALLLTAVAEIVGGWIEGCARDGFDAVEICDDDHGLTPFR